MVMCVYKSTNISSSWVVILYLITGRRLDSVHQNPDGLKGFPAVLQQISKIINIPQGQPKSGNCFALCHYFIHACTILHSYSCVLAPLPKAAH